MAALSVPAWAQAISKYDGSYVGVSGNTQGGTIHCPPSTTPAPLTISNGNIASGARGSFEGTVTPDGRVVLHSKGAARYDGTIDSSGVLKVGGTTPRCTFYFVWRKR
jgi:hypothetical protein